MIGPYPRLQVYVTEKPISNLIGAAIPIPPSNQRITMPKIRSFSTACYTMLEKTQHAIWQEIDKSGSFCYEYCKIALNIDFPAISRHGLISIPPRSKLIPRRRPGIDPTQCWKNNALRDRLPGRKCVFSRIFPQMRESGPICAAAPMHRSRAG
jgi:hypothetical protein